MQSPCDPDTLASLFRSPCQSGLPTCGGLVLSSAQIKVVLLRSLLVGYPGEHHVPAQIWKLCPWASWLLRNKNTIRSSSPTARKQMGSRLITSCSHLLSSPHHLAFCFSCLCPPCPYCCALHGAWPSAQGTTFVPLALVRSLQHSPALLQSLPPSLVGVLTEQITLL